jgi:arginine decarboxylase
MRRELAAIPGLGVIDRSAVTAFSSVSDLDLTRLTVDVSGLGLTGLEADDMLHSELGVTAELPELRHLTLIVSLGNTPEDVRHGVAGFQTLAEQSTARPMTIAHADTGSQKLSIEQNASFTLPVVSPREAFFAAIETVDAIAALGRISADTISAYPPGIPTIVAGEVIGKGAIAHLTTIKQQGGYVTGGDAPARFRVLAQDGR